MIITTGVNIYRKLYAILSLTLISIIYITSAQASINPNSANKPLIIQKQGSFFVGGQDVRSETLSRINKYAPSGTITVDQIYVRYQIPENAEKRHPLVLIHGCCLTGVTWETTPDGRMGWDEYFVRRGYPTYIIDQAGRGRSAMQPSTINSVALGKTPAETLPQVFSAGHEAAWTIFRFGPEYNKPFPGMQFPLEAQKELWKQMVPDWSASLPKPNPTVPALSQLAQRLKGSILISHSQSGIYPFQAAKISTDGIAGIVALEPGACPAVDEDMTPYVKMPILVVFGDFIDRSTRWAPRRKACKAFVQAANKAGGKVELVNLPDIGIKGNSHMLMMDKNSLQVADWLTSWLKRNVED